MNMPTHCDRCGARLGTWIQSKFNADDLCMPCKADEKLAPGYEAANLAELASVKGGDYNFPGVGLSAADQVFLAERRKARQVTT